MTQAGIYRIAVRGPDGLRFYIGQAANLVKRKQNHLAKLRRGSHRNRNLQDAFVALGEESVTFETVLICASDIETLCMYEQTILDFHIDQLGPDRLYNVLRDCVSSRLGIPVSAETKAKMRAAAIGRRPSEQCLQAAKIRNTGRKLSAGQIALRTLKQTGLKRSAETRAYLSASLKGKTRSPETRDKISTSKKAAGATPAMLAHVARLAVLNAGKPRSDATKAAISATKLAARKPLSGSDI